MSSLARDRGFTFSYKFSIHFWRRVEFGEHDHALSNLFPTHFFEGERCRLPSGADGDGDPFALNGADMGVCELAQGVRTNENRVAGMDDT